MDPRSLTIYYTRSDKGLIAMGLGGKKVTLVAEIEGTPYLRLIGFGTDMNELVLSGLVSGKDGFQREVYYLYNISDNSWKTIVKSEPLPQKGM